MYRPLLAVALVGIAVPPAFAQKKTDNDVLPGGVWTFEANKGELHKKGEFRLFDKRVWAGEKNIGTIAVKGDEATLVVHHGFLNGRILIKWNGRTGDWIGVHQHADGSTWQFAATPKVQKPATKDAPKKGDKPKDKK